MKKTAKLTIMPSYNWGIRLSFSLMMLFTTGIIPAFSQQNTGAVVNGRILNNQGKPLAASVVERNTSNGTTANAEGYFILRVSNLQTTLIITSVGFRDSSVALDGRSNIEINLQQSDSKLDDVVVVAFGTQKKETVTGAISSIKTKEIKQSPAANLAVTLAGRLPGLTSIQRSGQPGRDVTQLFIRGQGTVNAQSPIVLVDGIERDLTYIDPNEIETITILKDASSTAIFGVRGANGVIMVTTKRGASEIPEINFIAETSTQDFPRFITPVNSYDYASLRNLALRNDGLPEEFSADALEHYKKQDDPLRFPNTDWRNLLLKDYSLQQRYNLNISGASKAVKYFVNAGYLNQGGQFKNEQNLAYDPSFKLERYNFRSNIDVQLNKSLKIFLNVAGYLEQRNTPYALGGDDPTDWIIYFMNRLPATVPGPTTPDGDVITAGDVDRPAYGLVNRSGYTQQKRSNVLATFGMEQNLDFITKGLSARAVASFDSRITNNLAASRSYAKYTQVINPNLPGSDGQDSVYYRQFNNDQNTPLSIGGDRAFETLSNIQLFLNYYRRFNKHSLTGLALYQQQSRVINNELPYKLKGAAARISYGYDNRYFLEFNAGYNGSEQFAKGNRYGFFPALSASYVISNEQFLEGNNALTLLKLRGSYGLVGNDRIGSRRFLYLDDIQVNGGGFSGSLGNGQQIATNLLKNENLQWEVSKKTNIGLELGLFKDISIIADVFFEKRDNILRNRGIIPVLNGFPVSVIPPVNLGIVENKGYEIEMSYRKIFSKDFSLLARVNVNHAVNKQIFADEPLLPDSYAYQYRETGYRIGQYFGYVVDSYFKDEDDVKNSPVQTVGGHESRPGDFKYRDLNGDGLVNERDIAPIGYSAVPEYQYGAAFSINYKDLDISALFQGVSNVSNYYSQQGVFATNGVNNYVARHLDSWTDEKAAQGDAINYPRLTTQANPNENPNSFFIINAGYVRLKNVEIGYTLPLKLSNKIHSKRVRFYVSGLNLITWDKLPTKEFDPELTNSRVYPITRMYNAGVNIAF
jgi:TonB-linked SusC/RagA family outer membrane protein